jgi:phenylalanyl-tRNA synthetase beta chain
MKVPVRWLKEYVEPPASPQELARHLVMAGAGVEGVEGDVLDLEITANRADLLSMLGVARETGVILGRPVKVPDVAFPETGAPVGEAVRVEVGAPDLCPRYTARLVRGVKVGPSPAWMQERLLAAGLRPVNNVVDVTNYVLLESGQPLHAFDAGLIRGGRIVVRRAAAGERLVAIDGKTYEPGPEALVIADAERAVAIAGVMGGKETEIGPGTTEVLLECAQFDPVSIRRTGRRLGLSSDSSYRFERGTDDDGVDWASRRATGLILELAGGAAAKGVVDVSRPRPPRPIARVRPARVARVLGLELGPERVRKILEGLGAVVKGTPEVFEVEAPAGRRDLVVEADYIEEVARIEGYDRIPCDIGFGVKATAGDPAERVREEARQTLVSMGAYEVLTWSFAPAGTRNRIPYWTPGDPIPLRDPQGAVDRTLREAMSPGLLEVLRVNEGYKEALRPVFEIAHVYGREASRFFERNVLALAVPGDPLQAKGFLEVLTDRLGVPLDLVPSPFPFLDDGAGAELYVAGAKAGFLGAAPESLSGLRREVGVAELDFDAVVAAARLVRPYREFNRLPPVERDLSLELREETTWREVEARVREAVGPPLEAIRFQSEYRGKGIGTGRKGWAFSMRFRVPDRTLTAAEADAFVASALKGLEAACGARLRGVPLTAGEGQG